MTKQTQRRRIFQSGLAMVVLGAVLGIAGVVTAPAGAAGNDHQITICHANGDGSYSSPHPFKSQITSPDGHGSHSGDIIPPFAAGSQGSHSWNAYPGKNWTTENQAIHAAGCNATAPAAGSITLDKLTAGDGLPAGTTEFSFTVVCETESGTVADPAPSVAPDDPATTVASGLSEGDLCTITETNAQGATSTSYTVGGGAEQAGAAAVVTITDAEQSVAVVFENTYTCPTGTTPDGNGGCETTCVPSVANNQCVSCPVGTPDGTGRCIQPTDACPTVEGFQADVSECPVIVQDNTVTQTDAKAPAQVAGVQVAQLPRTGSTTVPLAQLGFGLVLMGIGALLFGKDQAVIA